MKEIKAVIGANYGDEGKGLVTNYLAKDAIKNDKSCLVVLNNGGAQRGHTVVEKNIRHVFHHFGSGTLIEVPTYISESYILNPMIFVKEYKELREKGFIPHVSISTEAIVSSPYDMLINQIVSKYMNVHNSCGLGIWETVDNKDTWRVKTLEWYYDKIRYCDKEDIYSFLSARELELPEIVHHYLEQKSLKCNMTDLRNFINDYTKDIDFKGLKLHWIEDLFFMIQNSTIDTSRNFKKYVNSFDRIIIENGQGLLLDKDYDKEYGTPSKTNCEGVYKFCRNYIYSWKQRSNEYELIYVSRNYLTRHGDGDFTEGESIPEYKLEKLVLDDKTNIPNDWQGVIKFRTIDYKELFNRVKADSYKFNINHITSIALTHIDDFSEYLHDLNRLDKDRYIKYLSDSEDKIWETSGLYLSIIERNYNKIGGINII